MPVSHRVHRVRRAGIVAAIAALPLALAYRFALVYRVRAGYPHRHPPVWTPDAVGLAYEDVEIPSSGGLRLPGWYMPAGPAARPGVVLVHGWESASDRTIPHAQVLHAVGFHVLTFDVRGNGANGPEDLPMSVGEYAADARAAVAELRRHPEVTTIGLLGHSMGAAGSLVAAAEDPDIAAVIAVAAPADPIPAHAPDVPTRPAADPRARGLAARLADHARLPPPRGHTVRSVSATSAVRSIERPVLLIHGPRMAWCRSGTCARLAGARRAACPDAITETLLVEGGRHSWLYEFPEYRATIARFLTASLGGPFTPDEAAAVAAAVPAERLPDPERLTTLDAEPGGFRSLTRVVRRREMAARRPDAGRCRSAVDGRLVVDGDVEGIERRVRGIQRHRRRCRRRDARAPGRLRRDSPRSPRRGRRRDQPAPRAATCAPGRRSTPARGPAPADDAGDPRLGRAVDLAKPAIGGLLGPGPTDAR